MEYLNWQSLQQQVGQIAKAQQRLGAGINAVCTTFFNLVDGAFSEQYLDGLRQTLAFCKQLGIPSVITQAGKEMPGISQEKQKRDMVETLKRCAAGPAGSAIDRQPDHPQ